MNPAKLKFADFELDVAGYELSRSGRSVKLERIPMELLLLLVDRRGQLVTRQEILEKLWGKGAFLDVDNSINTAISKIRVALRDDSEDPVFIKTVPGKGYRFIAPSTILADGDDAFIVPLDALPATTSATGVEGLTLQSKVPPKPRRWRPWLAVAGVLLAAVVAAWRWRDSLPHIVSRSPSPVIRSLAVLPLENLTGDPSQEYFCDGMTDALISELARISALKVTSRTSVMRYKDSSKPVKEIARELAVDAIVEGSVLRSTDRVRITAQLIDARTDSHLLSRTYEGQMRDVLALQGSAATAIAEQIRIQILPGERARLSAAPPVDPEAYGAYLKGRYFRNKRTLEGLQKAREYFQQAIDKDPVYAPAYSGLADTYVPLTIWGWLSPREAMPKARAAALKALELDEGLAEAHVSLGMVRFMYEWDWVAAGKHFERALALNPAYPEAHRWYSSYLMALGRKDEALAAAKHAVELDPVSPDLNHHRAWLLNQARQYDRAIEQERKTLELDPGFPPAYSVLAGAYLAKGMYREALAEAEKLSELSRGSAVAVFYLASVHARSGERSRALRELDELRALSKRRYVPSDYFAVLYFHVGDTNQAFTWLEKAFEERTGFLPWLKVSPTWDPLRSDPRFLRLLRRLGLPE